VTCYFIADVFAHGAWVDLESVEDPSLKDLAATLPSIALHGKAPATIKKYSGAFGRWKKWAASRREVTSLPAKPIHVALYLSYLAQSARTAAPLEEAVNALSWVHRMATVEDITDHPIVVQVLAGAKRLLAHKTTKKEPITTEHLTLLLQRFGSRDASLADVRALTVCLLGFAAFLRFDELSNLKLCDIAIYGEHMELFIESSKTDQLRQGARVVVARTNNELCPVAMLERYISMANVTCDSTDSFLFRGIVNTKKGTRLRDKGGLSYTTVRETVLEKIEAIGLDRRQYGLHSLRAGGASAAANAGVPDRMFKRHGRWRSENAKDGYVKDSLTSRLQVSKAIGL
jgi:integrase